MKSRVLFKFRHTFKRNLNWTENWCTNYKKSSLKFDVPFYKMSSLHRALLFDVPLLLGQCEQIKFLLYYLSCLQNFIISISQIKIFNPLLKKNKNTIQPILKEHQFGLANLFVSYPLFNREMRHCVIEWGIPFFF